ncbi:MAG: Wzz/FepE/Etk N-terminal domain-containing protein [Planctomycetota bacterium]
MNELEVPNLSLTRYAELLKRRRWQLVPAALLGLLVGAVIARLIPRYYEASTQIRIHPSIETEGPGPTQHDPLAQEVSDAQQTIRSWSLVKEAVLSLDWEDFYAVQDDSVVFNQKLGGVIERLWIYDLDRSEGRGSATILIGYRDQDPARTADFVNRITSLYIKSRTERVIARAELRAKQLERVRDQRHNAWIQALDERRDWQVEAGYYPDQRNISGKSVQQAMYERYQQLGLELADYKASLDAARKEQALIQTGLEAGTPPKEITVELDPNDPEVQKILLPLRLQLSAAQNQLSKYSLLHPSRKPLERRIADLEAQIDAFIAQAEAAGKTRKLNPAWQGAQARLAQLGKDVARLTALIEPRAEEFEGLRAEIQAMPTKQARYQELSNEVETTEGEYQKAKTANLAQLDYVLQLRQSQHLVVEYLQPPRTPQEPTYPNRLLVTLLGLLVAVLVAVGTIVLLDLLQTSFKSLDEVQRSLAVPVLGGVSYLELPEQVAATRSYRLRVGLTLGVMAVLCGAVVAVYLLDPLRLPDALVRLLDGLFGG